MNREYTDNGYIVKRQFFSESEIQAVAKIVDEFHNSWKKKNAELYSAKAVNSAYLTGPEHLNEPRRKELFRFIGSAKLMDMVSEVLPAQAAFMNTQLFFNPVDIDQKNYWHRDTQYHLSLDEQEKALAGPEVIHCRIPLVNEPGIELVPGTHKRWDSGEEFDVRMECNEHDNSEDLDSGVSIKLDAGDMLVFSANMIHRGLYGMNRMALDVLFCDPEPSLVKFANEGCLPSEEILKDIEEPSAFLNTMRLKASERRPETAAFS